ncbi:MAG: ribonuclease D, partial [Bacteroidota bacterium]
SNSYTKKGVLEEYVYIRDQEGLARFAEENQSISWLGFDTEFVGEKRYYTLLCLIQIVTENGYYLIDTLVVKDLDPFLAMIEDPQILIITHAGENDYRLLYSYYSTLPVNLFDTQIAAAFVGYKYPVSFRKLVENELGIQLGKGYTVSDWESRPMNQRQLKYALDDIIYLRDLWRLLSDKLVRSKRTKWALEELAKLEVPAYYQTNPHKEALNNSLILNLKPKDQIFMLRLYEWRRSNAERKNYSKEMILPSKFIGSIVRHINSGRSALKNHRRIPKSVLEKHLNHFLDLYNRPMTAEDKALLEQIPKSNTDFSGYETITELIHLLIKYKCHQQKMAPGMLIYGSSIKKMKADSSYFDERLAVGWRKTFLGEKMLNWLRNRDQLEIVMMENECTIRMKNA